MDIREKSSSLGVGKGRVRLRERLAAYNRFLKMEHTLFSLPLVLAGASLASRGAPPMKTLLWIILGAIGARTAALALNRLIDVRVDRLNPRTRGRELPAGVLSLADGGLIALGGVAVYLGAAHAINDFCLLWSWVPLALFVLYPMLKRFTSWCHLGLGVTWAMAPLGGWFAVSPGWEGSGPVWWLALFSVCWLAGFDIIYATLDEEFDRRAGLYSMPARWGRTRALQISAGFHGTAFLFLSGLFLFYLSGTLSAFLLLLCGGLFFLEHVFSHRVELAFFNVNVLVGWAVWGLIWAGVKGGS